MKSATCCRITDMPCESVYDPVEDDRGTVYMRGGERGEGERERERDV